MNPSSNYYLAINTGFPNDYDRANERTGALLMIHGDCSSSGCYAMTDEQIAEIYALARESFSGGQKSFQVQAFPFRMTPLNMARHRNSPHLAFWRMLKQGYDHFEVRHVEPRVNVCENAMCSTPNRWLHSALPSDARHTACPRVSWRRSATSSVAMTSRPPS
jgi:murein L,D-transpeptidase YafK